jgi:hypothetical protein
MTFVITRDPTGSAFTARGHWPTTGTELIVDGDTREDVCRNVREGVDMLFAARRHCPARIEMRFDPPELASPENE